MTVEEARKSVEMEELEKRIEFLEKRRIVDSLTLLEILGNITFFGGLKKEECRYAKDGQCKRFSLKLDAAKKIPIATKCRIKGCNNRFNHFHLELSNISCALCPEKQ